MQAACTVEDVEALGVSPPASPEPLIKAEDGSEQELEQEQGHVDEEVEAASSLLLAQRGWPYFSSMPSCFRELDLWRVPTEHGGVNNCLMYSYSVASGELHHRAQKTACAKHSAPTPAVPPALTVRSCVHLQQGSWSCRGLALHGA